LYIAIVISSRRKDNDRYFLREDRLVSKREESRARILIGAGRAFRSLGFGGSGVDGLAKASGVTSGAFYAHFESKADAFRQAVVVGMRELQGAIRNLQEETGQKWLLRFVDMYLGEKRTCDLAESCALQSLTGEVARADEDTRAAYEAELRGVIDSVVLGVDGSSRSVKRKQSIAILALLAGGVSLARAVRDPALSEEIAIAVRSAVLGLRGAASSK
jgi:TetR/AcrR family transcriptional repressor of nem operon